MSTQEGMKAKMDIHQENMEATIHSIRSELEEIIKNWVKDVLFCVYKKTQGVHKELTEKIDVTQVDLQAVKASIYTWTGSLGGDIMDTKDFHEATSNTRNNLHEELDLMFQVKAQAIKAEIRISEE
jgi:hypothetical protein